jgi:hypothetical protein
MDKTLTYSELSQGWPSFYSFIPERIIGMNGFLYTFKNGNLYKHNTNTQRNTFYGVYTPSSVTSVFNDEPMMTKTFKAITLDSDSPWKCELLSNLGQGIIEDDWFDLKEGYYYGYIRRLETDLSFFMRSAQGIGGITSVNSSVPSAVVLTFSFGIGSIVSVGDTLYINNAGVPVKVGVITNTSANTITVNTTVTGGSVPIAGQFAMYLKNSVAESYGVTGYYCQFKVTNDSTQRAEIFAVESDVFRSYP